MCRRALGLLVLIMSVSAATALAQCRVDMNPPPAVRVTWTHVSENSAAVGVETTRAARTVAEWWVHGNRQVPGTETRKTEPHFQHLHHLTGLQPGQTYDIRVLAETEDGKRVGTEVLVITPRVPEGAVVRIPEDLPAGPPYVLDKPDTTYIVTKDLSCPAKAFEIAASDVTLDLNGHTVTYDDDKDFPRPQGAWNVMREEAAMGVRIRGRGKDMRILNGTIRQGAGNHAGAVPGVGYNPVFVSGAPTEIAGIHAIWSGDDVGGFFLHGGDGYHVHHCVTEDKGSGITNRHQAICNIGYAGTGEADHNLVKRSRHRAINALTNVHHNEIHVDSQATNAFGIDVPKGKPTEIHHNRIYGVGEHPIGIGATGNVVNLKVYANYVEVQNTQGGAEYGSTGSACYRMTWGDAVDDVEVYDNVFVLHAKKDAFEYKGRKMDSHGRAVWIGLPVKEEDATRTKPRVHFHDNTVIANNAGAGAKAAGIAVVCLNSTPLLVFRQNRIESNWGNVLLSDSYGHAGGYPRFISNSFVRIGRQENYATVKNQYGDRPATAVFIDNSYIDGAAADSVSWMGPSRNHPKEIRFDHYLNLVVKNAQGHGTRATVLVRDKNDKIVYEGETNVHGTLTLTLAVRSITPDGTEEFTPHTVTAKAEGKRAEGQIRMTQSLDMTLTIE